MDVVTIGHGEQVATISNVMPPSASDPYEGGSFDVTLRASGLTVTQTVFIFAFSALGAYLSDLAEAWRGWPGTKVWESPEGHLSIEATSDRGSHVRLKLIVRNGPMYTWISSMDVQVEAGEEIARIARDVEYLLPSAGA